MRKEIKMNLKSKVAILLMAVFVTLFSFNLIASTAILDMLRIGNETAYKTSNVPLKAKTAPHHSSPIKG